jgi:uncharacterized protein YlaI
MEKCSICEKEMLEEETINLLTLKNEKSIWMCEDCNLKIRQFAESIKVKNEQ